MPRGKVMPPEFMGDKYSGKELTKEKGGNKGPWGAVTYVEKLSDLPPNITERIPELKDSQNGYILKEYKKYDIEIFNEDDLDLFDDEIADRLSKKGERNFSAVDKAMILQKRQDEVARYFGQNLPNAVVKSHYFVARPSDMPPSEYRATSDINTPTIYEIQEQVDFEETLSGLSDKTISQLSSDQRMNLVHALDYLYESIDRLLDEDEDEIFVNYTPDLHGNNIAITFDGEIKLFDTNLLRLSSAHPYSQTDASGHTHEEYCLENTLERIKTAKIKIKNFEKKGGSADFSMAA